MAPRDRSGEQTTRLDPTRLIRLGWPVGDKVLRVTTYVDNIFTGKAVAMWMIKLVARELEEKWDLHIKPSSCERLAPRGRAEEEHWADLQFPVRDVLGHLVAAGGGSTRCWRRTRSACWHASACPLAQGLRSFIEICGSVQRRLGGIARGLRKSAHEDPTPFVRRRGRGVAAVIGIGQD